ncbi:MAG: type II CAAX prenyl endopeptidase Rce1 family protein [Actinomycetota bacterium]
MTVGQSCPACGDPVDASWSFCRSCGAERDAGLGMVQQTIEPSEEDRRLASLPGGEEVRWSVAGAGLTFLLSLVATAVVAAILAATSSPDPTSAEADRMTVIALIANQFALFGATTYFVLRRGGSFRALGFRKPNLDAVGKGVAAGLLGVLLSAVVAVVVQLIAKAATGEAPADPEQIPLESSPAGWIFFALAISTMILAPIAEETYFRGMLHQAIRRHTGLWAGILLSSVAFAVVHVIPLVIPSIFALAILLAFAFEKERTIWVPIIAHATFNVVGFWASFIA